MEEGVELIIHKGRTIPQTVKKCSKCGKAIVSANEYERVRKELHPSLFDRIRKLFKVDAKFVDIAKGRIL